MATDTLGTPSTGISTTAAARAVTDGSRVDVGETRTTASATLRRLGRARPAQWCAFALVHLVLWLCALLGPGMPLGDVTIVYLPWAQLAHGGYAVMGLNTPWVYPVLAMVPILLPFLAGSAGYVAAWLAMITLLDALAFVVLTARGRRWSVVAAWWWLAFLLLLGPIAIGRLDSVSVPIVIIALVWLQARPRIAAALLAIATWVKVWPAGVILAIVIASRRRRPVLVWVAVTSAVIVLLAVTFGGWSDLFSFVWQQTGRGLQIEAPVSTFWMWATAMHAFGAFAYYDQNLLTFQVSGVGIDPVIAAMTPALAVAVLLVCVLGMRAVLRRASTALVLPQLTLAVIGCLIAFNKVGSPQYIDWLCAPVMLGILLSGRRFRTPAVMVAITAGLTQLFYPYLYLALLEFNAWMLLVLTLRNLMLFVVLGWAVVSLWRAGSPRRCIVGAASVVGATAWPLREDDLITDRQEA
jgi:hypothetical protein